MYFNITIRMTVMIIIVIVIIIIITIISVIVTIMVILINTGCYAMYCSPCAFYDMAEDMEPGTGVNLLISDSSSSS